MAVPGKRGGEAEELEGLGRGTEGLEDLGDLEGGEGYV